MGEDHRVKELAELQDVAGRIENAMTSVIEGKDEVVRTVVTVLLAQGHLLVEDVPGVGKTMLAKALGRSIDCTVQRVQFTPDLLPSDVTGVSVFNQDARTFEFRPGGVWEFEMHGPDGTIFPNWIQWQEIVPEELISYVQGARAGDPDQFAGRVTFAEVEGGTEIVLRSVLASRERRDYLIRNFNAAEGGRETLERLDGYVRELDAGIS